MLIFQGDAFGWNCGKHRRCLVEEDIPCEPCASLASLRLNYFPFRNFRFEIDNLCSKKNTTP
ncbi:MAG: hypothetical protein DWQ02_20360 [Bacteroidetes bacterium]|nr:MAG: hypothetical protein DWQ02_20360 [Bacteroidota bacterium]